MLTGLGKGYSFPQVFTLQPSKHTESNNTQAFSDRFERRPITPPILKFSSSSPATLHGRVREAVSIDDAFKVNIEHSKIQQRISQYAEVIPPAITSFPRSVYDRINQTPLSDEDLRTATDEANVQFNRSDRIRAFYFFMVLLDASPGIQALEQYPLSERGQQQLGRMYSVMNAIENIVTEKTRGFTSQDEPQRIDVIDPKEMHVQVDTNCVFILKDGKLLDTKPERFRKRSPNLRGNDRVIVAPSTCEYTLIDAYGRVMVFRVTEGQLGKPYTFPYKNVTVKDINEAIIHGEVVFSLPKDGTDLLGEALQAPYIAKEWQLTPGQKRNMRKADHEAKLREILDCLSSDDHY